MNTLTEINNLFNRLFEREKPKYLAPDEESHYFEKFGKKGLKENKKDKIGRFLEKLN